jgi:hypothetical protein
MILIHLPSGGISHDVFPDTLQFGIVADDVFIIIALPDGQAGGGAQVIDDLPLFELH